MKIRNTYWIAALSLLLSLSMALPYCCHADISELFSPHQETSADVMSGHHQDTQQCDCGHEFVKDFQKTQRVAGNQALSLFSAVALSNPETFAVSTDSYTFLTIQPRILSRSGPPIYLLNSAFLN